jgi:hypothetical protein
LPVIDGFKERDFAAAGTTTFSRQAGDNDQNILSMPGYVAGEIEYLTSVWPDEPETPIAKVFEHLLYWLRHIHGLIQHYLKHVKRDHPYGETEVEILQAVCRLVVMDTRKYLRSESIERLSKEDGETFGWAFLTLISILGEGDKFLGPPGGDDDIRNTIDSKELERELERYLDAVHSQTKGMRPFILGSGHIGLGPGDITELDTVVILKGAKVPYVLRERPRGPADVWEFVGPAYVQGMMDGELLAQQPGERTFRIR